MFGRVEIKRERKKRTMKRKQKINYYREPKIIAKKYTSYLPHLITATSKPFNVNRMFFKSVEMSVFSNV